MSFAHIGAPLAEDVARQWWTPLLRGFLGIVFGVYATFWIEISVFGLALSWGTYMTLRGLLDGQHAIRGRWWTMLAAAIAALLGGLVVLTGPDIEADAMRRLVGSLAITTGLLELIAAFDLRRVLRDDSTLALMGCAAVTVGILLLTVPTYGVLAVAWLIGVLALVDAVLAWGTIPLLRRSRRRARRVALRALGAYRMPHAERATLHAAPAERGESGA